MDQQQLFSFFQTTVNNPILLQQYSADPNGFFATNHIDNQADRIYFSQLFMAYQLPFQQQSYQLQKNIFEVNVTYQNGLMATNKQTIKGFHSTMVMYQVSFYLGVLLLLAALVFAIVARSSLFPILFGTLGTLDLLTFFIVKPPQSLQRSRSEQAKLNAAFYSWFINLYNWNSYLLVLGQQSQKPGFDLFGELRQVANEQIHCTEKLMTIISENINADVK